MNRDKLIIKTCIIGILTNVLLVVFKAFVGMVSNSIAVILDAVNNLSDAISSIITIVGIKLAGKLPDKKHPLGYGRIEYLTSMIVSGIVLYAGITSIAESIKKIIYPEAPDYSITSLIIIAVAVLVKVILGKYVKAQGEKVNSGSLIASGSDALFDAILSASVFVSAIIFIVSGFSLEAYIGVAISCFIIKSGIEMMKETLNEILGTRADTDITNKIKHILSQYSQVRGVYDLIMYNYGPDKYYTSVHLEVPDTMTAKEIDDLTRKMETKIHKETGVILTGVGIYAYNTQNDEAMQIEKEVIKKVLKHKWALQVHGFYLDIKEQKMRFDVVMSFDINPEGGIKTLYEELHNSYPKYELEIVSDVDVSTTK